MEVEELEQIIKCLIAFSRSHVRHVGGRPEFFWTDEEMIEMSKRKLIDFYDRRLAR